MKDNYILTAESVTEGHPDKLCDYIADSVLDACLHNDPDARVACEVLATAGKIIVAGEITTKEMPDIPHLVCKAVREIGYDCDYEVEVLVHDQSIDTANAIDWDKNTDPEPNEVGLDRRGGAREQCEGDQRKPEQKWTLRRRGAGDHGIVYGYATRGPPVHLPLPVVLAQGICMCSFANKMIAAVYADNCIPMKPNMVFDLRNLKDAPVNRRNIIKECEEVRVLGDRWTDAMWKDIHSAEQLGIPIFTAQKKIPRTKRKSEPTR